VLCLKGFNLDGIHGCGQMSSVGPDQPWESAPDIPRWPRVLLPRHLWRRWCLTSASCLLPQVWAWDVGPENRGEGSKTEVEERIRRRSRAEPHFGIVLQHSGTEAAGTVEGVIYGF